jgi:formate-dependent nitrite reductase membrane component NrfD
MPELQTTWGWLLAAELFLIGIGAGIFLVTAILYLVSKERYRDTIRFGAWASVIGVGGGLLFLLAEIGKPLRAMLIPFYFVNFGSWLTIGAYIVLFTFMLYALYALLATDRISGWLGQWLKIVVDKNALLRTILCIIGIPLSLGAALYGGMLLSAAPFIPFWYTGLLPAVFTFSSLFGGVAVVAAFVILREKDDEARKLQNILGITLIVLALVTGICIWVLMQSMLSGSEGAVYSAEMLTEGALSSTFWIVVVAMGLVLPILFTGVYLTRLFKNYGKALAVAGAVSGLAGIFTLRLLVLSVGLHAPLVVPALDQVFNGITFIP